MNSGFYKAFEEKYRGTRSLIKSRLKVYLPFISHLTSIDSDCQAVDLGCGRGEWLELMGEVGVRAHGVDIDNDMLKDCLEIGLSIENREAISYLKTLDDDSQNVVSAFHLAEHIPFGDLQDLVQESLRVLKPAGLLILETPNPENIIVGTTSFYLDPTHLRPLPPELLAFLPEYYGFYRAKILRLQESPELLTETITLSNVLGSVSPDYAVIAQKGTLPDILAQFNECFNKEYGISLGLITNRFESDTEAIIQKIESNKQWLQDEYVVAQKEIVKFNYNLGKLEAKYQSAKEKINELTLSSQQWQMSANQADAELKAVYASKSWRIMVRVRQAGHLSLRLLRSPLKIFKHIVITAMKLVIAQPQLKNILISTLSKFPRFKRYLNNLALSAGLSTKSPHAGNTVEQTVTAQEIDRNLSPRARNIYSYLKQAIKTREV